MEPIGALASSITIAALVKTCLDAFELIKVARNQDVDSKKLMLRLNIERARLYTWGRGLGLDDETKPARRRLRDSPFEALIRETLQEIANLLYTGEKLKEKYGQAAINEETGAPSTPKLLVDPLESFTAAFSHFRFSAERPPALLKKLTSKTKWVYRDRQAFDGLVDELRVLINGLQDITKSLLAIDDQQSMLSDSIRSIANSETLGLISEECQVTYPSISEVASERADVISMATYQRHEINEWVSGVDPDEDFERQQEAELQNLPLTELQAVARSLLAEVNRLRAEAHVELVERTDPRPVRAEDTISSGNGLDTLNSRGSQGDLIKLFEDEKREIINSCLSAKDEDGRFHESYITHIRVEENSHSSAASPDHGSEVSKQRILIISVRQSGRVRLHKARENANSTFSIGRTWLLEQLSTIECPKIHATSDLEQESLKISLEARDILLVMDEKRYYWRMRSGKERDWFMASLVKIYNKYTRGQIPVLLGWPQSSLEAIEEFRATQYQETVLVDRSVNI